MSEWFRRKADKINTSLKKDTREGMWMKCPTCLEVISRKIVNEKNGCCSSCNHHFRINSDQYVKIILDDGYYELWDNIKSLDPLNFNATQPYKQQIDSSINKTKKSDAISIFKGKVISEDIMLCIMDFSFIGGSMGSVVGEKLSRAISKAKEEHLPLVIICSSGGARMQEGVISVMQLAKICSKLADFCSKKNLLVTLLTDPTMGGTTASYGMLGDIILAEPNALIGFAGQRVIKQTIGEDLPEGFQRAEFLKEHGFVDEIVSRNKIKDVLYNLVKFFKVDREQRSEA